MFASLMEQGPNDGANSDRVKYPDASKFKDANRPPGWYTVKVGGKDVARYWPGGKDYQGASKDKGTGWKVNGPNPNAPIGMGQADDPRADAIRQGEWDARNQGMVQGTVDNLGTAAAGSLAVPMTTWSGLTTGAQNAWNSFQNAMSGQGDIKAPTGSTVTPGARYPSQKGGKWGYTIYDKDGKPKWEEDARATPIGDRVQGIKDYVSGTDRNVPVVPGLTGPDGVLTPLIPGGGGDQTPPPSDTPPVDSIPPSVQQTPPADVTQDGPNKAGLTPMQQWAKRFPALAAKVKPGQAGYDEIQKMNSPQSQARAAVPQTNVGDMNKAGNNVQQAFKNPKVQQAAQGIGTQTNKLDDAAAKRAAQAQSNPQAFSRNNPLGRTPTQPQQPKKTLPSTPRLDKALSNVGKWEEEALQDLTSSLFEGLPEPKVNYLKDMDPYDPRRAPRDHAPGSPLPPPSMRPGLPPMKLAKKQVKKPGNVKKA